MTVLNRPLFRQAGGPAEMMPQDLGPEAAMLQQAEQQAAAQAEQIGAQYAQNMMASLDSAESPEDLINALRGNQKPLDARYAELAQFVGEEDARNTPESVLAFAQPVIMMTEQGAMDSGIGELMQGLIGDVDMAMGMDEGVGSLMMAGAQEAPVPQNFNQGGAVQKYAIGGAVPMPTGFVPMLDEQDGITATPRISAPEPRPTVPSTAQGQSFEEILKALGGGGGLSNARNYYDEMLPLYQEILGRTDEDRDLAKAQTFFDIAQAGLSLASGTDPRTGQNMAGRPFAAQLAAAASPLPQQMAARSAQVRQEDRGIKTAALDAALRRASGDEELTQNLRLAVAKEMFDSKDPKSFSPEYYYKGDDIKVIDKAQPDANEKSEQLLATGFLPGKPGKPDKPLGGSKIATAYAFLSKPEHLAALTNYMAGDRSEKANLAAGAYNILLTPETDPETGFTTQAILTAGIEEAVRLGQLAKDAESSAGGTPAPVETSSEETSSEDPAIKAFATDLESFTADMEQATGLPSGPKALFESMVAQVKDIFDIPVTAQGGSARAARRALQELNLVVEQFILDDQGRPLSNEFETIQKMLASPEAFQDDQDAYAKIRALRNYISRKRNESKNIVGTAKQQGGFTAGEVSKNNRRIIMANEALSVLDAVLRSYETGGTQRQGINPEERPPLSSFWKKGG